MPQPDFKSNFGLLWP